MRFRRPPNFPSPLSEGPIIGDKERLDQARKLLDRRIQEYLETSRELARAERQRDRIGGQLAAAAGDEPGAESGHLSDLARRLDRAIAEMNREGDDDAPKDRGRVSDLLRGVQSLLKAFENDRHDP